MTESTKKFDTSFSIMPTGTRRGDWLLVLAAVRQLLGDPSWILPKDMVMHHGVASGSMQVIPFELHGALEHTGWFTEQDVVRAVQTPLGRVHGPGFMSDGGPAIGERELGELEQEFGIALDPIYRQFLQAHNGGRPANPAFLLLGQDRGEILDRFFGLEKSGADTLLGAFDLYSERIPRGSLPVARDPFGNLILLCLAGPQKGIMSWSRRMSPIAVRIFTALPQISRSFSRLSVA